MNTLAEVMTIAFSVYALIAIIFLISENRRPQATLAWALAFFFMPGLALLIYILFGRDERRSGNNASCCCRISRRTHCCRR